MKCNQNGFVEASVKQNIIFLTWCLENKSMNECSSPPVPILISDLEWHLSFYGLSMNTVMVVLDNLFLKHELFYVIIESVVDQCSSFASGQMSKSYSTKLPDKKYETTSKNKKGMKPKCIKVKINDA